MLTEFFAKNLEIAYFIHGAAFFTMGITIFAQLRRTRGDSVFRLAVIIWMLGGFGVIRGLNEWLYMFAIMRGYLSSAFDLIWALILTLSYIFVFEFGRRLILLSLKKFLNKWVTVALCFLALLLIFTLKQGQSIWPRYLLGFPGGMMTAFGFFLYYHSKETILRPFGVRGYFLIAAVSICFWGILAGLVPPKANFFPASVINNVSFLNIVGIPVQVFRAVCATFLAWSVWNILRIFDLELQARLKNSLEEAVAAKDYAEGIAYAMPCALIVVDPDRKIRVVNQTACELLGYKEEELVGKPAQQIFEEKMLFGNTKLKNYPLTYISKDKVKIPVLFSKTFLTDAKEKITGIICIGKDMRDFKDMEEKLMSAEKLAAMGKVSGIIGHEFRNQLGAMGISVYFLKMKLQDADEKVKRHLATLEQQFIETDRIIENILAFSKVGRPEFKSVNLEGLLLTAIGKFQTLKDVLIDTQIEKDLPAIQADEIQLTRAFVNIISNAMDAMSEKGKLSIKAFRVNGSINIIFEDTGHGIEEEVKKRIFEPFFSTRVHGIGLGLFICKSIIEAHGGSINIESELDKGTVVTVTLPTKG